MVGAVQSQRETAWVALVEYRDQPMLLCGCAHPTERGRRMLSGRVRAILRAVTLVDAGWSVALPSRAVVSAPVRRALRDIGRWHARRLARDTAGPADHALAPLAQRAARQLAQIVQRFGPIERAALRGSIADAERVVNLARGSGAEDALARWCALAATAPPVSPRDWISAWQREPVLVKFASASTASIREVPASCRVRALLLIGPDYTSACHDTRSFSTSTAP